MQRNVSARCYASDDPPVTDEFANTLRFYRRKFCVNCCTGNTPAAPARAYEVRIQVFFKGFEPVHCDGCLFIDAWIAAAASSGVLGGGRGRLGNGMILAVIELAFR